MTRYMNSRFGQLLFPFLAPECLCQRSPDTTRSECLGRSSRYLDWMVSTSSLAPAATIKLGARNRQNAANRLPIEVFREVRRLRGRRGHACVYPPIVEGEPGILGGLSPNEKLWVVVAKSP
jgi:hypothetical protein